MITKGPDAEMDDDQRNARILDGARAFMESSTLYKLPGHKPNATDLGMWKLVKQWPTDEGQSMVYVYIYVLSLAVLIVRFKLRSLILLNIS